jgi:putative hemolysin
VAGLITHSLGHIPQAGEEVVYEGYRLVVRETKGQRISQVLIAPRGCGAENKYADRT